MYLADYDIFDDSAHSVPYWILAIIFDFVAGPAYINLPKRLPPAAARTGQCTDEIPMLR